MLFSAAHQQALDAVRTGDLDTLEQTPDEQLVALAEDNWLIEEAVKSKQWAAMWCLLDKAEQLDDAKQLTRGWTRAHGVAAQGDLDVLRDLTHEELAERTDDRETPVHVAAMYGRADAVEFLVRERGLDHSAKTAAMEWTPLHVAAERGHAEVIATLVQLGANIDLVDVSDRSALVLAAREGHVEAMRCLLRLGCSTLPPRDSSDSAMHYAARSGSVEAVDVLLESGKLGVEEPGFMGLRPLHCEAQRCDVVMVKHLLDLGAQVNAVDEYGSTALHYATRRFWRKDESAAAEVLRVLLLAGADRSIENQAGKTARDSAMDAGYESLVELLDEYWPITSGVVQLLLGLRGPTESPLTRFSSHALFEPRVLSLVKCLLTGEDKGAFSQLVEEVERS